MVATALCALYLGLLLIRSGDVREFIRPGQTGREGYDGQFTYDIARDPQGAPARIAALCRVELPIERIYRFDAALHPFYARLFDCERPAYRLQRILHAALARLLSLGQAALIPWAMLIINLSALAAGTAAIEQLLVQERANRWFALTYGLFGGIFFSVRVNTTEPLAYGLVALAILAATRERHTLAAGLLALGALTKETTLFFVAGYGAYFVFAGRWRDAVRLGVIALLPFAAWQVALRLWVGQFGIGSGGAGATPFEIIPFNGIWRIATGVDSPNWSGGAVLALMFFPIATALLPSVWALWRSLADILRRRWHLYVFLLAANAAIMPFVPFSTYAEPLGIIRFLPGLVIGVLLYAALRRARRALVYSTIWIVFGVLFLA